MLNEVPWKWSHMKNKDFDSVKMMREIRDELSKKFLKMTFEEQKKYIKKNLNWFVLLFPELFQNL